MFSQRLKDLIARDGLYLIALGLAIIALIWTQGTADDFQNECNQHWIKQMQQCHCNIAANFTDIFTYKLPIQHLQNGNDKLQ